MASTPLTLVIEGETISPSDFGEVVREFAELLNDIDTELSPGPRPSLQWRIVGLSHSSPAQVDLLGEPTEGAPDIGLPLAQHCVGGFYLIEHEGTRPEAFSDDALERLRRIAALSGNGISTIRVEAPSIRQTATITKLTFANIDVVLTQGYSVGGIEGQLDGINIHAQPFFTVYDEVSGRAVRCYFALSDLERILDAMGTKVAVHGQLRRDPAGRPSQMRPVEFFEQLGQRGQPVPAPGLSGIYRGLGDSRSYLAVIRGE
jgi:hypothetical protein